MDKSIQIQHQVRENAEELQDYLKDLVSWEKEMKKKEEEIKKLPHEYPVLPPIRTARSSTKKKKTKDKKPDSTEEKSKKLKSDAQKELRKPSRIPGYDYRAWDLYNVDEAIKEVEESEEVRRSSSEEEEESEDSENEMFQEEKKMQLALIEKDKGNQFFKKGDYDMAISCYTAGIEHDPNNALLPANRAMALLKKGQLAAAEADCTQCLILDPTYVKAYMRRGTARMGMKKYKAASEDFNKVLDLDPGSNQAKLELQRLQKEMSLSKSKIDVDSIENEKVGDRTIEVPERNKEYKAPLETENKIMTSSNQDSDICSPSVVEDELQRWLKPEDKDSSVIIAIQKPPHLRSQKPMKKITIKDVSGITAHEVATTVDEELSLVTPPAQEEIISVENGGGNPAVAVISVLQEESFQSEDADERLNAASVCQDNSEASHTVKSETLIISVPSMASSLPPVPSTSYQFLGDWKKLRNYPGLLYEYVKQFPPERLPVVFNQSIDTELFCGILQILSTAFVENCEDVFSYLNYLRKVGRFKTLVMFLDEAEITALSQLFQYAKSSQKYSLEEILNVEKDYGLS